jgi:hypothetical protein
VHVDLREAELADGAEILATTVMGAVTITVPPGVSVEMSGFALMSGNTGPDDKVAPARRTSTALGRESEGRGVSCNSTTVGSPTCT